MTSAIDLNPNHLGIVERILAEHVPGCEVRAFGSRAAWTAMDYSDIDLAVVGDGPLPWRTLSRLREAFEESRLPMRVDVLDWHAISEGFRESIESDCVVVQGRTTHSDWPKARLGDVAEIVMGQSPPGNTVSPDEGLPLLNGPTEFGAHHPFPVQFTTDARKRARPGDVLFCVRGSTTGRMNWADREYAIGRGVAAIRHRAGHELQPMLRGVIQHHLSDLLAQATGSTFPNVSAKQLAAIPYPDLCLEEQRAIAGVLGALDDKIELNRRRSETLEEMARALFRSWFVDFDPVRAKVEGRPSGLPPDLDALFPASFEASELGEVPAGWKVKTLGDAFRITMGQSPPGKTYNQDGDGLPLYQGRTDFGFRFPSRRVYCTAPTRLAGPSDTLVSVRAPVGDVNMAMEPCCVGRGVAAVRHASGSRSYTYYSMQSLRDTFERFEAEGTVFGSVNKKDFHAMPWVSPPQALVAQFETSCSPLDGSIEMNERATASLAAQRDALLPRLISGELRARDA